MDGYKMIQNTLLFNNNCKTDIKVFIRLLDGCATDRENNDFITRIEELSFIRESYTEKLGYFILDRDLYMSYMLPVSKSLKCHIFTISNEKEYIELNLNIGDSKSQDRKDSVKLFREQGVQEIMGISIISDEIWCRGELSGDIVYHKYCCATTHMFTGTGGVDGYILMEFDDNRRLGGSTTPRQWERITEDDHDEEKSCCWHVW